MTGTDRVLIVDDSRMILKHLTTLVQQAGFHPFSFLDPLEALRFIRSHKVDIALVDFVMPHLNGIELTKEIRNLDSTIPIVMITSVQDDASLRFEAIESGITEFLTKPINEKEFLNRIRNLLNLRKVLDERVQDLETRVEQASLRLQEREKETLQMMAKAAEYKNNETGYHIQRVAHYSKLLARFSNEENIIQDLLFYSAPLHDIGKIGIPDRILLKPGRLTEHEFDIIKTHTTIGYDILRDAKGEYLKAASIIALTHHEKYDGSGYPNGLQGNDIPLWGRIVAVADVFDALTSPRPYKDAWPFEKAVQLLIDEKGKHFDPTLINTFTGEMEHFYNIYKKYQD